MSTDQNVLIPVKLDAFVLNDPVCDGGPLKAKIAPITQPNYTFLRLDNSYLQPDISYNVDLHSVSGADVNSRITDLGTGKRRENRRGVYLHWTIPRIYRSGVADAEEENAASEGLPNFPEAPSRWLVVRQIEDMSKVEPAAARSALEPLTAWVVESDRCRTIDGPRNSRGEHKDSTDILPDDTDLQIDVAPFVDASSKNVEGSVLEKQAEIFIGEKILASKWTETAIEGQNDPKKRVDIRLMGSSNELFPDFQPHCSNVFSIVDNFYYGNEDKTNKPLYATVVKASYSVIGWNSMAADDIVKLGVADKQTKTYKTRQGRFRELNMHIKGFQDEADPMASYPAEIVDWFRKTDGKEVVTRSICHGAMYGVSWDLNTAPKNILADRFAKVLAETQPVAIGTTPMDAIMAYAGAHEGIEGGTTGKIEAALKRLEAILLSRDDGVEAHMQAADMMYNWNYSRFDGGDCYHAAASGEQTKTIPGQDPKERKKETLKLSPEKQATLSELNRLSRLRDAAKRRLKEQQWNAFSLWWQAVTKAKKNEETRPQVERIAKNITALQKCIDKSQESIKKLLSGIKAKDALPPTPPTDPGKNEVNDFEPGVLDPYQQQRDPTLLVGGIQSGWEVDYLLKLLVRLDCQIVTPTQGDSPLWKAFFDNFVDQKMPHFMRGTVKALLREFVTLKTRREDTDDGHPQTPSMLREQGLMNSADFKPFGDDWHLYINSEPERPALKSQIPLYHDRLGRSYDNVGKKEDTQIPTPGVWRDLWNDTQPWFPLFLEWEVEYFHIKHDDWDLTKSKWWANEGAKLHYNIREGTDLAKAYEKTKDRRPFAGRVLILPQPGFTLNTKITQLLQDTLPSELDKILGEKEREYLVQNLNQLQFLSSPLSGFNSHLQTVDQGNHVKPSLRDPSNGSITFLPEANRELAGFNGEAMKLMGLETDVTPYGAMKKPIDGSEGPSSFKPVSHGQFKLTKVNVIDKFGQAINLLDPNPLPYEPKPEQIPRAWPCLSDWYAPGAKLSTANGKTKPAKLVPNTVEEAPVSGDKKHEAQCEFAQVPPQINQPARLNATWVIPSEPAKTTTCSLLPHESGVIGEDIPTSPPSPSPPPFWRAASEWDSPIWGWVVVNYANYGLQFFLPSGAFYREVRTGGPNGAMESPDWLPFTKPDDPDKRGGNEDGGPMAKQLARLIEKIASNSGYLKAFIAMVNSATTSTGTSAPSAYSEFKSALIGKPLALVNMGFSLELSQPLQTSQLLRDGKPEKQLYKDVVTRKTPGPGCERNDVYDKEYYRFPVQLGDLERGFDGLVCYFKPKLAADLKIGDALNLDMMYTHFGPDVPFFQAELAKATHRSEVHITGSGKKDDPYNYITTIGRDNYPKLPPYYIDPLADTTKGISLSSQDYEDLANGQLAVFGAIVDPFSAVHAYSGVLPVKELLLPDWTWQGPIQQISAFFHAGPVLVTWDVPKFNAGSQLTQGKLIPKIVDKKKGEHGVALPGGSLGQWTWLQPYMEDKQASKPPGPSLLGGGEAGPEILERFMPVAVDLVDDMAHLERGPYTALEGYLQMASGAVQEQK
ncbi:hypothetical protein BKA59DRAFT_556265 [Fusarium tricinctum]|uniref:Uncharacterized protein n=1 Tax=Fusarium tricinctum TaxID=61284 RepID=A0A8K0S1J8_9HYPO|nr:hypothetical protein BKA59DRAFT_556265 [Fusarium tricinctum]